MPARINCASNYIKRIRVFSVILAAGTPIPWGLIRQALKVSPCHPKNFVFLQAAELFGGPGLTLPSKILTPYGDLGKNFKFLKEVKILSEFLRSKLACLMPIYVSGRPATKVPPSAEVKDFYFFSSMRTSSMC